MLEAISSAFTAVLGWVGEATTALVTTGGVLHDLLPVFAIGVAVSSVLFAVKGIRSLTWGA